MVFLRSGEGFVVIKIIHPGNKKLEIISKSMNTNYINIELSVYF